MLKEEKCSVGKLLGISLLRIVNYILRNSFDFLILFNAFRINIYKATFTLKKKKEKKNVLNNPL